MPHSNSNTERLLDRLNTLGATGDLPWSVADVSARIPHDKLVEYLQNPAHTTRKLEALTPNGLNAHALPFGKNVKILVNQARRTLKGGPRAVGHALKDNMLEGLRGEGGALRSGTGVISRHMVGPSVGLALSALPALYHASSDEDPTGRGRGRAERSGEAIGSIVGSLAARLPTAAANRLGMAALPVGMVASLIGSKAGGAVGGLLGKGLGKLAPRRRKRRTESEES
jgi:hypothetical protein